MDGWTDRQMNRWMMGGETGRQMVRMDGWLDRWADIQRGGQTDRWVDKLMDGWADRRMDGWVD